MKNFTKIVKWLDKHLVRLNRLIYLDVFQGGLYSYSDYEQEEMVEKLHDLSLTHRVYEIEDTPDSDIITILVQPSTNHSTNIDCNFIQACLDYLVRDEE